MKYTNLGASGLQVSRVCLGGNSWGSKGKRKWTGLDAEDTKPFLKRALDLGVNFFDTAPSYNAGASEEILGEHLVGSVPRSELVLLTKAGMPRGEPHQWGLGRKRLIASVEDSLRRLRTDHLDLLVLHRFDPRTPIEEIMTTLHMLVTAGKVRYVGASTMPFRHFMRMHLFAKVNGLTQFIEMQNFYNLLYREDERELVPFCEEEGIALTPYSPLAKGILSGNRAADGSGASERAQADAARTQEFYRDHQPAILDALAKVAGAHGVKPSQIALAWLLHQRSVAAPVVGATKLDYIDDAAAAVDIALGADEFASLEAPYQARSVVE
ncbi:aldo/keto reductase [Salipiger sp.]|uniref:aldo/keto reductase n=1 Tax=Salipiger sp. TaxID=2078585 RepID=UPI003A981C7E